MVQKEAIEVIKKFLKHLSREGIHIQKAYLYGSYANGCANSESDIDVMLISEQFDKNDDKQIGKVWSLGNDVDSRIEPYIVGQKKFLKDDVSPIFEIVRREGLEIKI